MLISYFFNFILKTYKRIFYKQVSQTPLPIKIKTLFLPKIKVNMSLIIQLPVTTEHYLRESATREGMPLERYISQLLTATSIFKEDVPQTYEAQFLTLPHFPDLIVI